MYWCIAARRNESRLRSKFWGIPPHFVTVIALVTPVHARPAATLGNLCDGDGGGKINTLLVESLQRKA